MKGKRAEYRSMKAQKIGALVGVLVVIGSLLYLGWQRGQRATPTEGVQVVASFYPWAEFSRQVGGDLVQVSTVVPAGSEPHEYEPSPQDLARVYEADVFIYNGSGIDPWAERIASELEQKGGRVLNMSEITPLLALAEGGAGHFDPHFWLDPVLVESHLEAIRSALAAVAPQGAAAFQAHREAYVVQLRALDQAYRQGLAVCARRDIVTSHAAFGYIAKRYNLEAITIAGLSPEEEPSARTLSEITKSAREKNTKYIFFETLVSPKLAQTVADEIGADILVFNPLEGLTPQEVETGQDYLSVMRGNLQNLRIALDCR